MFNHKPQILNIAKAVYFNVCLHLRKLSFFREQLMNPKRIILLNVFSPRKRDS